MSDLFIEYLLRQGRNGHREEKYCCRVVYRCVAGVTDAERHLLKVSCAHTQLNEQTHFMDKSKAQPTLCFSHNCNIAFSVLDYFEKMI